MSVCNSHRTRRMHLVTITCHAYWKTRDKWQYKRNPDSACKSNEDFHPFLSACHTMHWQNYFKQWKEGRLETLLHSLLILQRKEQTQNRKRKWALPPAEPSEPPKPKETKWHRQLATHHRYLATATTTFVGHNNISIISITQQIRTSLHIYTQTHIVHIYIIYTNCLLIVHTQQKLKQVIRCLNFRVYDCENRRVTTYS